MREPSAHEMGGRCGRALMALGIQDPTARNAGRGTRDSPTRGEPLMPTATLITPSGPFTGDGFDLRVAIIANGEEECAQSDDCDTSDGCSTTCPSACVSA